MCKKLLFALSILLPKLTIGQDLAIVPLTQAWKEKIEELAPTQTRFPSASPKKILLFSLHTGFEHWVIPHTEEVFKILGSKTKQFEVTSSKDIHQFEKAALSNYDAIILNNTCSKPDHRHLFWDQLRTESILDSAQVMIKAQELETNLIEFVSQGGGLLLLHGAITTLNNSQKFSALVGASFDYHPPQQQVQVEVENPSHPLVAAFPKKGFSHVDEPYFYKNAYANLNFTPLLYFDNARIKSQRANQELKSGKTYLAWIRPEGKGKIMYIAPSHNAQSFENPALLQFFLDGLQYVVGDVRCDETPLQKMN
ncbi:MAG: ThuA domain-containing protein [Bacteroidetes bacterium]|nr:ThuA domain-containing protein [Bacteroidota bacterium]